MKRAKINNFLESGNAYFLLIWTMNTVVRFLLSRITSPGIEITKFDMQEVSPRGFWRQHVWI